MALPSAPSALDPNSGDVKWRRVVGNTAEPRFQSVTGGYRLVSGTSNPAVGTAICKYGVSTGQTCDSVVAVNTCANGYCGLTKVGNDISNEGDSGGPWFFGNTAMGIHHGTAYHGLKIVSAFTRIGALNLLSVVVVTG
jgi:streptogrisin C